MVSLMLLPVDPTASFLPQGSVPELGRQRSNREGEGSGEGGGEQTNRGEALGSGMVQQSLSTDLCGSGKLVQGRRPKQAAAGRFSWTPFSLSSRGTPEAGGRRLALGCRCCHWGCAWGGCRCCGEGGCPVSGWGWSAQKEEESVSSVKAPSS